MKTSYVFKKYTLFRVLIVSGLILFSANSLILATGDPEIYRVKENFKIKRTPDGTVSLYSIDEDGKKEEFVFTEFDADVLLLIYRRVDMGNIMISMSRKYYMSKIDTRRSVKMTLNELQQYDIIRRD